MIDTAGPVQELSQKSIDDLVEIKGVSQITARRIIEWFDAPENREVAASLARTWGCHGGSSCTGPASSTEARAESEPVEGAVAARGTVLRVAGVELMAGDAIVATGTIPGVKRAQIEAWCALQDWCLCSGK